MGAHNYGWKYVLAASVCLFSFGCQGPESGISSTNPSSSVLQDIAQKVYGDAQKWQTLATANPDFDARYFGPGGKFSIPLGGRNAFGPLYSYDTPGARPQYVVNIYIASADREKLDTFISSINNPPARTTTMPRSIDNKVHSYMVIQADPAVISDAVNWRLELVIPHASTSPAASMPKTVLPATAKAGRPGGTGLENKPMITSTQQAGRSGRPGQSRLPSWPAGSFKTYVVWEGDTVWEIAKKFYGSGEQWMLIAQANPDVDMNDLRAGQRLVIPPINAPSSSPSAAELNDIIAPLSKPAGSEFQPATMPASVQTAVQTSRPMAITSEPAVKPIPRPASEPASSAASQPVAQTAPAPIKKPASQPAAANDARKIFIVGGADELIAAVGSDRIIRLKQGQYDLSSLSQKQMDHILWSAVKDGSELTIRNVRNLRIEGPQGNPARLIVKPRYAYVLNIVEAEGLELANLVLGHDENQPGTCTGGVLNVRDSRNISLTDCELFGCGTQGMSLYKVAGLKFEDSVIRKCTEGIMVASACSNMVFHRAKFTDNGEYNGVILIDIHGAVFEDCLFSGNVIRGIENRGILFDVSSCTDVAVKGGMIRNNVFSELVKPEKAAAFSDVKLEDNRRQ